MKKYLKNLIIKFMLKRHRHISKEERYAIIISKRLIDDSTSELLMHPTHQKYYIKYPQKQIFVVLELQPNEITIINHVYCYNVKLSQEVANTIENNFIVELEKRRQRMENEYMKNIEHSLQTIAREL